MPVKRPLLSIGEKYGTNTVVGMLFPSGCRPARYITKCECGATGLFRKHNLMKPKKPPRVGACHCAFRGPSRKPKKVTRALLPAPIAIMNCEYSRYRHGARLRNFSWALSKDEFYALVQAPCFYCGAAPSRVVHSFRRSERVSCVMHGVDRIDSRRHYTKDNVVTACAACNLMKGYAKQEDFLAKIREIAAKHP